VEDISSGFDGDGGLVLWFVVIDERDVEVVVVRGSSVEVGVAVAGVGPGEVGVVVVVEGDGGLGLLCGVVGDLSDVLGFEAVLGGGEVDVAMAVAVVLVDEEDVGRVFSGGDGGVGLVGLGVVDSGGFGPFFGGVRLGEVDVPLAVAVVLPSECGASVGAYGDDGVALVVFGGGDLGGVLQ